jgi:hypothetical protein
MDATVQVFQGGCRAPYALFVGRIISVMLDDARPVPAPGLPHPTWLSRTALQSGLAIRPATRRRARWNSSLTTHPPRHFPGRLQPA